MDAIVVGQHYRLVIRPNPEYVCGGCGRIKGTSVAKFLDGQTVTVMHDSSGEEAECHVCGYVYTLAQGIYCVDRFGTTHRKKAGLLVVPYTWLESLDVPYDAELIGMGATS